MKNWRDLFKGKPINYEFNEFRVKDIPGIDEHFFETRFMHDNREYPLLNDFLVPILLMPPPD